jgi:glycine/D-amino acid oxidase-like deaminating enzyme
LSDGDRVVGVRTSEGDLGASAVIVANGAWACGLLGVSAVRPIRGQMISLGGSPERLLRSVIYSSHGYVVPRVDGRVLVGATVEDVGYRKEVLPEAIEQLRNVALEIAPSLGNFDIKEAWAGLRPFSADGLPVIGRVPGREGLFAAAGHFRNGILLAPITAEIVADALTGGGESEYLEAFSPERFFPAAASNRV